MLPKHFIYASLCGMALIPINTQAGEIILIPKLGYQQHDTTEFDVRGNVITFKRDADSSVIGFEGGYLFDYGLAVTGEILLYQLDIASESAGPLRGEVNMAALTANATYHFNQDQTFQPLIGAGFGAQAASIDNSNSNIDMGGYRVHGKLGFLIKFNETVGMTVEYKRTYFHMVDEDDDDVRFKSRGNFLGAGVTIQL